MFDKKRAIKEIVSNKVAFSSAALFGHICAIIICISGIAFAGRISIIDII